MNDFTNETMEAATAFGILGIIMVVYLLILGIGLAQYILNALALYTIADRRRIKNAWLAWIPYGSLWIIGSIVDLHDRQKGKEQKWRIVLLTLSLAAIVCFVAMYIAMIIFMISIALVNEEPDLYQVLGVLIPFYIGLILASIALTAVGMCQAICIYKIFEELAPEKTIKYILLYLLVPLAGPLCLMKCRNSENGIPPAPQPAYYPPYDVSIPPFQAPAEPQEAESQPEEP